VVKLKLFGNKKTNPLSKSICVYRGCGGYGDIINMRMIFQDIKKYYKEYSIDWCLPHSYFDAAQSHPFVDNIIGLQDYNKSKYKFVFDLTTACTNYEWKKNIKNDKNRADIWAIHAGVRLSDSSTFMPVYKDLFDSIIVDLINLGWDKKKKIVVLCPYSATEAKNMTSSQILFIKDMVKDYFLVSLHNKQSEFLYKNKIPCISNYTIKKSMSLIYISNFVISTDTGHLHCSGAYNKPSLGLFCYTNGNLICKYYKSVVPVQIENLDCGPCYLYTSCVKSQNIVKPCRTNISLDQIKNSWQKLLNSNI
jgi:ADP-heptose:LPS heptosyltransferase